MIRATIQDANQTISFLTSLPTVMRLVAGCSINPKDLNELLIATDIYERGLAAGLMADLMEFDKSLQRQGDTLIHQNIDRARLAEVLIQVKAAHPEHDAADVYARPGTPYEELIAVMDAVSYRPEGGPLFADVRLGEITR